jgi:RNA polymerase sigma-70 factor (ECF subfamily)
MEKTVCETDPRRALLLGLETDLIRRARRLASNDAEARDLVQDTFERALRANRAPGVASEFRPWLMRLMVNLWIDRLRSQKRRHLVPLGVEADTAAAPSIREDGSQWRQHSLEDVRSALRQVPEPLRSAYQLHAMEGRSYAEVAATCAVEESTVGTRIHRARRYLRQLLLRRREEFAPRRIAA